MSISESDFNALARGEARAPEQEPEKAKAKRAYPPPFSLRLTLEERARLEKDAAGMALGAYIRSRLFGEDVSQRRTRGKFPVKDHEALGRVLAALGSSRISSNLNQLARAANTGSLPVGGETENSLIEAADAIQEIRDELLRALGPRSGAAP